MSKLDEYLGKVQGLLISAEASFSVDQLAEPWHLVQHGEPAEGLTSLAWVIRNDSVKVDAHIIDGIRELTEGMVDPDELPPDLDANKST